MINVRYTIVVTKKIWFELTKDWITNHFGRNPKNGGRPPNDKKDVNKQNFSKG